MKNKRDTIDKIDEQIAELFKQRMNTAKEIGQEKAKQNIVVTDPTREQEVLDKVTTIVGEELSEYIRQLYKTIFETSKAYQKKIIEHGNKKFCLIGDKLSHSYSHIIHKKFGYKYSLVNLKKDELENFCMAREYDGFNITIPYKIDIMPFLDKLDDSAVKVGCVNTVVKNNGKLVGYNTDIFGITYLANNAGIELTNKKVLILGNGGTAKTAHVLCKDKGAREIVIIDRNTENNYGNISQHTDAEIIINTTPVGMYPDNGKRLVDLAPFTKLAGVIDVIYNPMTTDLILQAKERNIKTASGLKMLVAQAKEARDLFLNDKAENSIIEKIYKNLRRDILNIVLIGMPSSGKSTVGKILAEKLNREFIDTDAEIVNQSGKSIPEIFEEHGEAHFRKLEQSVVEKYGKEKGLVISCGGGAVMNQNAYIHLKQNGVIILLTRDLNKTEVTGRPLLKNLEALQKIYAQRMPTYKKFADIIITNDGELEDTLRNILEKLNEHFDN